LTMAFKAFSKQLFGARYESAGKSLLASGILFFAIRIAEMKLQIAPFILYLTSAAFTGCIVWQTLRSSRCVEILQGMLMLPFANRPFVFSYTLVIGGYVLITKTMLAWALLFAAGSWRGYEIVLALICGCCACFVSTAAYLLYRQKSYVPLVLGIICILAAALAFHQSIAITMILTAGCIASVIYLFFANAYGFCHAGTKKTKARYRNRKGSIFAYLMRYLMANKNYLINTVGLCIVACFLPFLLGEFENLNVLPFGFAILCLNTSICTLLSCDADLEQSVKTMPGQAIRFYGRYCLFIACINFTLSCLYQVVWLVHNENISAANIWASILFAVQSAILSVILEWKYPVRDWKTESDLWHHPRKYIVPLVMLPLAALVGIWPIVIWLWSAVFMVECFALPRLMRRLSHE